MAAGSASRRGRSAARDYAAPDEGRFGGRAGGALAAEAERGGGRGSRSGGNGRNGYRTKKVMSEVGPITLQIPRDRLGTFRPKILPRHARRTGALDEMVLSLTARGMTSARSSHTSMRCTG